MEIKIIEQLRGLAGWLLEGPLWKAAQIMHRRFRDDHLGQAAGALTFTTIIALVPLCTVVLAMLFPHRLFRYYLFILYSLLRTGVKQFEVLQENLKVNMNIPKTLKILGQTTQETLSSFIKEFFDLSEIFVKGQSFAAYIQNAGVCLNDNDENRPVDTNEVMIVLSGWKLTYSCVINIFITGKNV